MRIAICEDNLEHAKLLTRMIEKWSASKGVKVDVGFYKSAEEFLYYWPSDDHYDLAFLDIQLRSMTGMQLAQCIRKQDQAMLLVFTTGLSDYVFRGYDVQAFQYLLKPIREAECMTTLSKAYNCIQKRAADVMLIPAQSETIRIFKHDIFYFENDKHYVIAHTAQGCFKYKQKLADLEAQLSEPGFCKCHRSFIVNMHHVGTIQREQVKIDNGDILPVSRSCWPRLNECFISYYTRRESEGKIQ